MYKPRQAKKRTHFCTTDVEYSDVKRAACKKAPRCKKSVDTLNWPLVSVSVLKMEEVTKVMVVGIFIYHHVEI